MMITVFTPTYNRKDLLKRCYGSLREQTVKDFEWLIVDDGSTDDSKEYIEKLMGKSEFPIRYIYQENGGKHTAFNRAVQECKTEYLLILDSDDMLTKDAIEILEKKCSLIQKNKKISGIIGNRGIIDSDIIMGTKIPDIKYASGLELYQKMGFSGDTLRLYKTAILKKYPFPIISGEKFMSENVVFDQIDQKYKMLVISEVLYLGEYQEAGLTKNIHKVRAQNPKGYALSLKSTAETALTPKKKFGTTILYIMWCKIYHIDGGFRDFKNKLLYVACLPASCIMRILHKPRFFFNAS